MYKQSNLLRAYQIGKVKFLDMTISFSDLKYLIKSCRDANLQKILQETFDEACKDIAP